MNHPYFMCLKFFMRSQHFEVQFWHSILAKIEYSNLAMLKYPWFSKLKKKKKGSSIPSGSYIVYYRGDVAIFKESRPWWLVLWILVSFWNMLFLEICINNLLLPSCVDWSYQKFNLKSNKLVRGPLSQISHHLCWVVRS